MSTLSSRTLARFASLSLLLVLFAHSAAVLAGGRQRAELILPEANQSAYDRWGYAPAIKAGDYIYVSGVIIIPSGEGPQEERYERAFRNGLERIDAILKEAGSSLDDVIKINSYHTHIDFQLGIALDVRKQMMKLPHPAWTAVGTTGLAVPSGATEIEVVAYVGK